MSRFYGRRILRTENEDCYLVTVPTDAQGLQEVEVSREVYQLIDDLQREFWRLERRESRHQWHLEDMYDSDLPEEGLAQSPESLLMEQLDRTSIYRALLLLPEVQRRRFLMRHLAGCSVKQIAHAEQCSERAVRYTLELARKGLQDALADEIYG